MPTLFTPNDGTLATFTLPRDPDRGEPVGLNLNNRQLVTAGGILDVLVKGPVSQSFPLSYTGLKRKEFQALDAYVTDVLVGGVKTFRLQFGTHQNLLTRTIHLGDDPPWQLLGASADPITTYPATGILAPDFSNTALQVDYKDWGTTGANQKVLSYARLPEGNPVTAINGDQVHMGLWVRIGDGLSLSNFHRMKIQTDGEDGPAVTIPLTDVWTFFSTNHTFVGGGGANLAWEIGSLATSTADYTVYYWHPSLLLNQGSISSGDYQVVPELDFGHVDIKFGSPALSWRESLDDGFNVTLNLFKMGAG